MTTQSTLPSAEDLDAVAAEAKAKADTAGVLPPTPDEIDAEIAFYENAVACYQTAKKTMDGYEEKLVKLTDKHGYHPEGAPRSMRLAGRRKSITVTRGQTVKLHEPAIQNFAAWCRRRSKMGIFTQLFASVSKYVLIESAREVVSGLVLPKRTHDKVLTMFGLCIDVKVNEPSVKVDKIAPDQPTRKQRAGRKVA